MALSQNTEDENQELYFSQKQLEKLDEELQEYESFDEFLEAKEAIEIAGGTPVVKQYRNIEAYWNEFVYDTDYDVLDHRTFMQNFSAPMRYWQLMRKALKERKRKREYAEKKQLEDYEQIAQTVTN